jgi:hypothetical protein
MTAPDSVERRPIRNWLPRILLAVFAARLAMAAWPAAPVEGDELGVLHGLTAWDQSRQDHRDTGYLFPLQPGSYFLLHAARALTHADALAVFAAVSFFGAAAFVVVTTFILSSVSGARPAWIALALLSAQELSAAAAYANTSALAAPFVALGLLCALHARADLRVAGAAFCFALGGWLRLDALLLTPAFPVLLLWRQTQPVAVLRETLFGALASLALLTAFFFFSDVSLRSAWQAYSARDGGASWQRLFSVGWLTLSGALVLAALAGLWVIVRRRDYRLLALLLAAIVPSLWVYGRSLTTTKYLYYAAPFLVLPAIVWLKALAPSSRPLHRLGLSAWCGLAFIELFLGVRTASPDARRFEPPSFAFALFDFQLGQKRIQLGFGSGEILPTDDGLRLRGALWHAPDVWRREKDALRREHRRLTSLDLASGQRTVITSTYFAFQLLKLQLLEAGLSEKITRPFPQNPSSFLSTWQRPDQPNNPAVRVFYINNSPADADEFQAATVSAASEVVFLNDRGRNAARHLLGDTAAAWRCVSGSEHGLLSIYVRPLTTTKVLP